MSQKNRITVDLTDEQVQKLLEVLPKMSKIDKRVNNKKKAAEQIIKHYLDGLAICTACGSVGTCVL